MLTSMTFLILDVTYLQTVLILTVNIFFFISNLLNDSSKLSYSIS